MEIVKTPNTQLNASFVMKPVAAVFVSDIVHVDDLSDNQQNELILSNQQLHQLYGEHFAATRIVPMGSMVLLSFSSAIAAVRCAQEVLKSAKLLLKLKLQVGMHLGEVTYSEFDVYGHTINIATMIQQAATAGQLLMSEATANNAGIETTFSGVYQLENFSHKVRLYDGNPKEKSELQDVIRLKVS